jgi:hypothetical protein
MHARVGEKQVHCTQDSPGDVGSASITRLRPGLAAAAADPFGQQLRLPRPRRGDAPAACEKAPPVGSAAENALEEDAYARAVDRLTDVHGTVVPAMRA